MSTPGGQPAHEPRDMYGALDAERGRELRRRNRERLAALEADGAARRRRLAEAQALGAPFPAASERPSGP
jgi:hypothetical protein